MILPDINLLIHAYNPRSAVHAPARQWWEDLLSGTDSVGLAWVVVLGFIRISTHRGILKNPLPVADACEHVRSWLGQPQVAIVSPGERHANIFFELVESLGTAGNLTTDAHLAALAIEYQAVVHSTDNDFARFPGVKWRNPLAGSKPQRGRGGR